MIIGAANNQLTHPGLAQKLYEKGMLYARFLVNSGGMIAVTHEYETERKPKEEQIEKTLQNIVTILAEMIKESSERKFCICSISR